MTEEVHGADWIPVSVAARILRCGHETVRGLVRRGKLRHRNRGFGTVPRYEVSRADVNALRDAREVCHGEHSQRTP